MSQEPTISLIANQRIMPLAKSVRRIMAKTQEEDPEHNPYKVRDIVVPVNLERFADGVSLAKIEESIRRTEVFVFYAPPPGNPDAGLGELGKILNAAHFASPTRINVVLPYLWEGRADRRAEVRVSLNVQKLADDIQQYNSVKGLFTFDLHSEGIVSAFRIPVDDLKGRAALARRIRKIYPDDTAYEQIAADVSSAKRSRKLALRLGKRLAGIVDKSRPEDNVAHLENFIGEIPVGKEALIGDDMIDTGSTLFAAAEYLLKRGVTRVCGACTHGLFNANKKTGKPFTERCRELGISVITTNTVFRDAEYLEANKDWLSVVHIDRILAKGMMASLRPADSVSKVSEEEDPGEEETGKDTGGNT